MVLPPEAVALIEENTPTFKHIEHPTVETVQHQ
jgi:hypothetical protein